jgi:hypothetical protein
MEAWNVGEGLELRRPCRRASWSEENPSLSWRRSAVMPTLGGMKITSVGAARTHAHSEFSCVTWAGVNWTTFLGLQFQMDCVGAVSFLS